MVSEIGSFLRRLCLFYESLQRLTPPISEVVRDELWV